MIFNWFVWFKSFFDRFESPNVIVTENHAIFLDPIPTVETLLNEETKVKEISLENMSKPELLAEAKKRGIKVNASLKKKEIISKIKNGA
jgi:hypothetical protein